MKKNIVAIGFLLIAGCTKHYPPEVRQEFVTNCVSSGGSVEACTCSLDGVERKYTLEEFLVIDEEASAGKDIPPAMKAIFIRCRGK